MSIAADYEFFSRPEWAALRTACEFNFRQQRQMQPDFMCAAVASGEVDVIAGYTRRADREIRSCRARRSQRRDPALRCHPADGAKARRGLGVARGAAPPHQPRRYCRDARGQPVRAAAGGGGAGARSLEAKGLANCAGSRRRVHRRERRWSWRTALNVRERKVSEMTGYEAWPVSDPKTAKPANDA
jgi:hypothetical protein